MQRADKGVHKVALHAFKKQVVCDNAAHVILATSSPTMEGKHQCFARRLRVPVALRNEKFASFKSEKREILFGVVEKQKAHSKSVTIYDRHISYTFVCALNS